MLIDSRTYSEVSRDKSMKNTRTYSNNSIFPMIKNGNFIQKQFGVLHLHYLIQSDQAKVIILPNSPIDRHTPYETLLSEIFEHFFFINQVIFISMAYSNIPTPILQILEKFGVFSQYGIEIEKNDWLDYQGCFFNRKSLFTSISF